jgi:peptide/nickel transport system substrate-binding protein
MTAVRPRPVACSRSGSRGRGPAALAALVLPLALLGACADTEAEDSEPARGGSVFTIGTVGEPNDAEPVAGGELDVSAYTEVRSMDPVDVIANGLSGGTELAAIYDVLVRYDPESASYEPHLAASLDAAEDSTVWTLGLREDVVFSDGTPLDAEAVVGSIERYLAEDGGQASLWQRKVASTKVVDARTVEFTMTEPWLDFAYMLATAPGMIVAPAAHAGADFRPIGAGPYTFTHHQEGEELLLSANPSYWGGEPALAELRFRVVPTAQGTLDVLRSGDADLGVLREPHVIKDAVESDLAGAMNVVSLGVGLIVNSREDAVTGDVLVRRAIAHALDPETVFARSYSGVGLPGTEMFAEESIWHTGAGGPEIDLEEAKRLVEEAKAQGFDGTVRYLGIQQVSLKTGVAIEAMLGAIGIEVESEYVPSAAEMIERVFVQRDFDLAGWSFGTPDAGVYPELFESFHSSSTANAGGYASPVMDGLIEDLGAATSQEQQREILEQIQAEWNETVPAIVFGAQPELVAWNDQVGGVVAHVDSMVLYHDAWVAS